MMMLSVGYVESVEILYRLRHEKFDVESLNFASYGTLTDR